MEHILKIHKYNFNQLETASYQLSEQGWVREVFDSIDHIYERFPENEQDVLNIELKLVRKTNSILKDHFIIKGQIDCLYYAPCIRCLAPSKETIYVTFSACYLLASVEETEEYRDLTEVYCDGEEMDLYFYDKGKIDLKELINEQIHLNTNPRPVHSENCKGLCSICGFNLNFGKCIHHRAEKK